jgi:pilus assembly protein CpaB
MRVARLLVLGVALLAGALAYMLSGRDAPPTQVVQQADTVDILVARADIAVGRAVQPEDMDWQPWPVSAAGPLFIRKTARPDAIESLKGSVARAPFVAGEPMREAKLIKADGSGFMSAILPAGMRAVSTEISPETGAAGFILPNDRVDVILTRKDSVAQKAGGDGFVSETILRNVRVLAIDQSVEEKNGQKVVVGKTTTLELTPHQTELLAVSRQRGNLSLALRSLADSKPSNKPDADEDQRPAHGNTLTLWRGVEPESWNCGKRCVRGQGTSSVESDN